MSSAPGYLALPFCLVFADDVLEVDAVTAAVSCGANRVRLPDTRAREARTRRTKAGRPRVRVRVLVEVQRPDRRVCVIETVVTYR
jgi:hypothetical protein